MKMRVLYCALLFCITSFTSAQDYTFKVLLNKGSNTIKTNDGKEQLLKAGVQITNGEIVTSSDGFLGLLHKSGKIIQLRGEGKYTIQQLQQQVIEAKRNSRFDQYIPARMSENERNRVNKGTRAVASEESVELMLPEISDLYGDVAMVRWNYSNPESTPTFKISVSNIFGEEVFSQETSDPYAKINFSEIENDVDLYALNVEVLDNGTKSGDYKIKKISSSERPQLIEDIEALSSEIDLNSPLELLIMTTFYEKNDLVLDAMMWYEQARVKFSDYEEIEEYYKDFRIRYGLE